MVRPALGFWNLGRGVGSRREGREDRRSCRRA